MVSWDLPCVGVTARVVKGDRFMPRPEHIEQCHGYGKADSEVGVAFGSLEVEGFGYRVNANQEHKGQGRHFDRGMTLDEFPEMTFLLILTYEQSFRYSEV